MMLHSVRLHYFHNGRSRFITWSPQKQRNMSVFGKKRTKRRVNPWKPPDDEIRSEWLTEYLEFGVALGFTPEETLKRLAEKRNFRDLVKDPKALAAFQELKKQEEMRTEKEEEIKKVTRGELDWNEIRKGLKNENARVPIWEKAKKYVRPERDVKELLGDSEPESERSEYGKFLLEDDDELPEDFSYEDFEAMIEQLPQNMVPDDDEEDLLASLLARPRSQQPKSSTDSSEEQKKKVTPKLIRPRGSAAPFSQQEEEKEEIEDEVEEKQIPLLASRPQRHKVKGSSKRVADNPKEIPELKAPKTSAGFFSNQLGKKKEIKADEEKEKSVKPVLKPRPRRST